MITILRFILCFLVAPAFAIVAQAAGASQGDFCIVDSGLQTESVILDSIDGKNCNYDSSGALLHKHKSIDGQEDLSGYKELGTSGVSQPLFSFLVEFVAANRVGSETTTLTKFFPSNDGFLGSSQRSFLEPGQLIDRIGLDKGKFFSPAGTPIPNRALRPGTEGGPLSTFRVLKPFEVNSGTIAPAFNRPGLGTQFQSPVSAEVLLKRGIIERIP